MSSKHPNQNLAISTKPFSVDSLNNIQNQSGKKLLPSSTTSTSCLVACKNKKCKFFNTSHTDICILLCTNKLCRLFNDYHPDKNCLNKCNVKNCLMYGQYHTYKCPLICKDLNCIMYQKVHDCSCLLKTTSLNAGVVNKAQKVNSKKVDRNIKIIAYNESNKKKSKNSYPTNPSENKNAIYENKPKIYSCDISNCLWYKKIHEGNCKIICTNSNCIKYQTAHSKSCCNRCSNKSCKYYKQHHKKNAKPSATTINALNS